LLQTEVRDDFVSLAQISRARGSSNRCDSIKDRLDVLSIAPLLAEAIHRIHHNESVSALFERHEGGRGRALSE